MKTRRRGRSHIGARMKQKTEGEGQELLPQQERGEDL